MGVVFQSPPVYGFDVMNEPVVGQHFFKSLVCVVMALVAWMVMMREVNGDECGDDDAGDDVLQIADFTANHLSCFSWWLQRCKVACAQKSKAQTIQNLSIFTQMKKKMHLADFEGGRDFLRSMSKKRWK